MSSDIQDQRTGLTPYPARGSHREGSLEGSGESYSPPNSSIRVATLSTPLVPHLDGETPPSCPPVTLSSDSVLPPAASPVLQAVTELLELSLKLPLDATPGELIDRVLDVTAKLLPDCALGVCFSEPACGRQLVTTRLPLGWPNVTSHDPTRLFPKATEERILPLEPELTDSTLHIAIARSGALGSNTRRGLIAERARAVLSQSLHRTAEYHQAAEPSPALAQLQQRLFEAEKLSTLGTLMAGIVHELNNPIGSILATAGMLHQKAQREGAVFETERLARIEESAERLRGFSRELIDYARPNRNQITEVQLSEILEKAIRFCEHELEAAKVEVIRLFSSELPTVRGQRGRLVQLFVNLLTNAAQAMGDSGGHIYIISSIERDTGLLRVDLRDEGQGMDATVLAQIFEPFFTTKAPGLGNGLGLPIVKDIIEAHGGHIRIESTKGRGTTVSLWFPTAE